MKKYQKMFTILALMIFSVVIALHYASLVGWKSGCHYVCPTLAPDIGDVRMPIFVLSVLYAGSMGLE